MLTQAIQCPRCTQSALVTTERNEVVVDVCPRCSGVWLDCGELEYLIELALLPGGPTQPQRAWDIDEDDRHDRAWDNTDRRGHARSGQAMFGDVLD